MASAAAVIRERRVPPKPFIADSRQSQMIGMGHGEQFALHWLIARLVIQKADRYFETLGNGQDVPKTDLCPPRLNLCKEGPSTFVRLACGETGGETRGDTYSIACG
jgi:hypothetical protein